MMMTTSNRWNAPNAAVKRCGSAGSTSVWTAVSGARPIMADLQQLAISTRDSIGRYFSVVSAVPSAVLVVWIVLLVGSGAWGGRPDPIASLRVFADLGFGGAVELVFAAIFLGVVTHPIQYSLIQFLEGYWGDGPVAGRARLLRSRAHYARIRALRGRSSWLTREITDRQRKLKVAEQPDKRSIYAEIAELKSRRGELEHLVSNYPDKREAFMPTRLGNVLRRYEWTIGQGYGIDPIWTAPYILSVAPSADVDYLDDQRSQLDLAGRMTIVSFVATALTMLFMARHGLWLLVALFPYASSYLSYRGAVVAAAEYGRALGVVITLNRFALYDRLGLESPADSDVEKRQNQDLIHYLSHGETQGLRLDYRGPPSPT